MIFIIWQSERIGSFGDMLQILFNGLRIDLSLLSYLAIIPALVWILVLPFTFRHLIGVAVAEFTVCHLL